MKNKYAGLSQTTTESRGEALTLESFSKMITYIQSKKYQKKENEKMRFRVVGEIIAGRAVARGVITPYEYERIMASIAINGGLIVSSKMYEKLQPIVEEVELEISKNVKEEHGN